MKVENLNDEEIKRRVKRCPECRRVFIADLDDSYTKVVRCQHWMNLMSRNTKQSLSNFNIHD